MAFIFAIACCLIAAVASLLRGGKYVHDDSSPALTAELADADIEAGLDVEEPALQTVASGLPAPGPDRPVPPREVAQAPARHAH